MQARALLNLGLAAAVFAAAAAVYLQSRPRTEEGHAIVPVPIETLSRIEIRRTQQPVIVLERAESGWRMTAPLAARVDEVALGRVLDLARFRAQTRLTAGDRARFELDQPWASIRYGEHRVEFGATSTLTQELYLASGEHVYAVPARLAAAIPAVPAKLLAHRLLGADEIPRSVRTARFAVVHDGNRWRLDPADPGLSQDDLVRWIELWKFAGSTLTQPATGTSTEESIAVVLRDGRTINFGVAQRIPDLVLVRSDEALAYHLPVKVGETLLAAPNSPAALSTGKP